jgi:hypothetical protein
VPSVPRHASSKARLRRPGSMFYYIRVPNLPMPPVFHHYFFHPSILFPAAWPSKPSSLPAIFLLQIMQGILLYSSPNDLEHQIALLFTFNHLTFSRQACCCPRHFMPLCGSKPVQ